MRPRAQTTTASRPQPAQAHRRRAGRGSGGVAGGVVERDGVDCLVLVDAIGACRIALELSSERRAGGHWGRGKCRSRICIQVGRPTKRLVSSAWAWTSSRRAAANGATSRPTVHRHVRHRFDGGSRAPAPPAYRTRETALDPPGCARSPESHHTRPSRPRPPAPTTPKTPRPRAH